MVKRRRSRLMKNAGKAIYPIGFARLPSRVDRLGTQKFQRELFLS
jgi:hypothetical protein